VIRKLLYPLQFLAVALVLLLIMRRLKEWYQVDF
jgi:hypothetical protein